MLAGGKGRLPVEVAGDSTMHQAPRLQSDSPEVASLDAVLDEVGVCCVYICNSLSECQSPFKTRMRL